jgi:hypothetical protein
MERTPGMAVGRRDSDTRAVGDTATARQAAIIITRAHAAVVGEHGSPIESRASATTQPQSPSSEVHALGGLTEDGVRRARTRSSDLADGGFPGSKKSE